MIEIYGTLGPSCGNEEILSQMLKAGMTGIRLNLSHASLQNSGDMLDTYKAACEKTEIKGELLIDLQGPELRIGRMANCMTLSENDLLTIAASPSCDKAIIVPAAVYEVLAKGDHILLDDGRIQMEVLTTEPMIASVTIGGCLGSHKNIKITGKEINGQVLTAQDYENIALAKQYGVSAVMQPFVRSGEEIKQVRKALDDAGCRDVRIFAKIENREGIKGLTSIIEEADMIVIARGDLGNDMPLYELPRVQREISDVCRGHDLPFMVVTQMLDSMCNYPIPTRAEVSDIFHAVTDGASAVMVTNETAVGKYPSEVISYLAKTVHQAEIYMGLAEQ